jgi:uncharacterized NAD(P)/FAD-binding protein YdhS
MSAFGDEPDHFVNWLRTGTRELGPHSFVRRSLYREYLGDSLFDLDGGSRNLATLDHYRARVVHLERTSAGVRLSLDNDLTIVAHRVILAWGHQPRTRLFAFCGRD